MEDHGITIQDLIQLREIIDLAATRGAFQASELTRIGETYDRLSGFLNVVTAQAKADAELEQSQGE